MAQRLVDVEGSDEPSGVKVGVGDQIGEPLLEPRGKCHEQKGQVVLSRPCRRLGEFAEPKPVVGKEEQHSLLQISVLLHFLKKSARWLVGHFDAVEDVVAPIRGPYPREETVLRERPMSGKEVGEPILQHVAVTSTAEATCLRKPVEKRRRKFIRAIRGKRNRANG